MNLSLSYYLTMLLSVKTQIVAGKRKIAKPILLLAIIQAISENRIIKNEIKYTDELENIYLSLFQKYGEMPNPMKYPFYHLQSDGFLSYKGKLTYEISNSKTIKRKNRICLS